jgi:hypothetical protein
VTILAEEQASIFHHRHTNRSSPNVSLKCYKASHEILVLPPPATVLRTVEGGKNVAVRRGQQNARIAKAGGIFLDPETIRNVELRIPRS